MLATEYYHPLVGAHAGPAAIDSKKSLSLQVLAGPLGPRSLSVRLAGYFRLFFGPPKIRRRAKIPHERLDWTQNAISAGTGEGTAHFGVPGPIPTGRHIVPVDA